MTDLFSNTTLMLQALSVMLVVLFVVLIIQTIVLGGLRKKYKAFTMLTGDVNLEQVLIENQNNIKSILSHQDVQDKHIDAIYDNLKLTFEKIGVVKYNAFDGMGGQMSAVIVLLNKNKNGVLLNSIHTREGNHLYTKVITNGKTEQPLSSEEELALTKALVN